MTYARILGTGHYLPEKVLTNDDLAKIVDTNDEWIFSRTGIRERHVAADDENTSDMATAAARRALEAAGKRPEDVDLLIVTTVTPDTPLPSCAAYVQAKLGAVNAASFDLLAACAGSIYGLSVADKFVKSGAAKCVVVVGVELLTRIVDWTDRNTCVLFGDAAGAMVIGPSDEPGIMATRLHSDGRLANILNIPGGGTAMRPSEEMLKNRDQYVKMNGREVYKVAVRALTEVFHESLKDAGITAEDIKWVTAHQANLRILETVLDRVGVPREKAIINIERYGNTSSASVPITLDEGIRDGRVKKGDLVAMLAIGAGMAWGGAVVRY